MTDTDIDSQKLAADLKAAGISSGDIVVIHASLKSIGMVTGGPAAVVDAFVSAVGPLGVLLLPSLTFDGSATKFMRELGGRIDLRNIESHNGAIPRAAAGHQDARRSVHPTHPVIAIGNNGVIDELFASDQNNQGPLGSGCPFYRAAVAGGKIALVGVSNTTNSTLHCLEEAATDYIFNCNETFLITVTDDRGVDHKISVRGYTTDTPRNFDAIEPFLLAESIMTMHKLGNADMRVIDAKTLISRGLELLAENPRLLTK